MATEDGLPEVMKAALLTGHRNYKIIEIPVPTITDDQVLVQILHVGICGSDSSYWDHRHVLNSLHPNPPAGSHGHEASGRVVRVGSNVKYAKIGDLVVRINCVRDRDWDMRCFAEFAVADAPVVVNSGDPRAVCFADPLAVAMVHVQTLFHPTMATLPYSAIEEYQQIEVPSKVIGKKVLVLGMGFIGILCAQLLRESGMIPVGIETVPEKIVFAQASGFECLNSNYLGSEQLPRDFVGAIECCGHSDVNLLTSLLADQGVLVVMGTSRKQLELDYLPLRSHGVSIVCPSNAAMQTLLGFNYWAPAAWRLEDGQTDPLDMIDVEFGFDQLQQALEHVDIHPEVHRALINM